MKKNKLILFAIALSSIFISCSYANVAIIVNKHLAPYIEYQLNMVVSDLRRLGVDNVVVNNAEFDDTSSTFSLRSRLNDYFSINNIGGAVLIGDLPIAEYEIQNDYSSYGYSRFPIDLYFMDLNGVWSDNATAGSWGATGVFDGHSGNRAAEIWISRIVPSVVPGLGTEVAVAQNYLSKVQTRLAGGNPVASKYLVCGDDVEWGPWFNGYVSNNELGYSSSNMTQYRRTVTTARDTASNWRNGLLEGYEYGLIVEHSGPQLHCTYTGSGEGYFFNTGYLNISSNVRFYNMFACSSARFIFPNFLGGLYAWGHGGLNCVGSTKTGSMLSFNIYNQHLGNGFCFGEAFRQWMNAVGIYDKSWHYGMTLLGAGFLRLQAYPEYNDGLLMMVLPALIKR